MFLDVTGTSYLPFSLENQYTLFRKHTLLKLQADYIISWTSTVIVPSVSFFSHAILNSVSSLVCSSCKKFYRNVNSSVQDVGCCQCWLQVDSEFDTPHCFTVQFLCSPFMLHSLFFACWAPDFHLGVGAGLFELSHHLLESGWLDCYTWLKILWLVAKWIREIS